MDQANQYIKQTQNKFGIKLDLNTLKLESFLSEKKEITKRYVHVRGKRQQQNERLK